MPHYDAVIIGAGLGGLLCGNILVREGMHVCVLEQNSVIGGGMQSFARKGIIFNTGLNYTESLAEGETLNRYFKYFGIMDQLKLKQMDKDGFERISFNGDNIEYPFAQGHDHFVETLASHFPNERDNLRIYMNYLNEVSSSFPLYSLGSTSQAIDAKYLHVNAYDYIKNTISDSRLQQVLAGLNSLYGGVADKTPLYVHALINSSFIRSSWRLVDGSSQLPRAIAKTITNHGGVIRRRTRVVKLGGEKSGVQYAELENGERITAKRFISNVHPSVTLNLVDENITKRAHKQRINQLSNTMGMFTLYLDFKPEMQPYLNFNHHHFTHENAWTTAYKPSEWPEHYMFYTPATSKSQQWADGGVVITYMNYREVAKWANSKVENRGADYEAFKREKAERLINFMAQKFPGIRDRIAQYYTSTPLTYRDYTGTPEGSAYGIMKDANDPLSTIISPKSRVGNLYFTGQNLNMHGVLGVTIGAVLTCAEFFGTDYLMNKIKKN